MTPVGNTALLVARILQPLARSLEEARRHLDLETVTSDEATDDTAPAPAPAPPYFAAPGSRRAFDRIAKGQLLEHQLVRSKQAPVRLHLVRHIHAELASLNAMACIFDGVRRKWW